MATSTKKQSANRKKTNKKTTRKAVGKGQSKAGTDRKSRGNGKSKKRSGGILKKLASLLPKKVPQVKKNTPVSEIRRIFALQQEARQRMRLTTAGERVERLKRLRAAIEARTDELHEAMGRDFRKAPREVDITEVLPSINEINDAIRNVKRWMAPRKARTPMALMGTRSEIRYEPRGVVLVIAPWNYPFHLAITPLVAAIAAGNCVMIKPSEFTPETSRFLASLLGDVFPEDEVAVVEGDHTVSQTLTELPFDHIFFTGSTAVGKIIMSAAAQNLASVTLELGGKSPVIVDEDADMEKAAERIAWGKVLNGGQTCVAPDYLLIAESKLDDFLQQSKNIIQEFYGENPMARRQSPDYCRIVNGRHYVRLRQLLEDSVKNGAEVVLGGDHADDENYIEPTYLANVDVDSAIMQEEIFGPILPILTYRSLGEAIEFINAREKPLALYVFSNNRENTEQILNRTSSGGAVVNDVIVHLANSHLPFGGVNHSGHGSYHGEFGFRALSHEKAVLRQSRLFSSIRLMYPPYTNLVKTIVNFTRKFLV